MLLGLAIYNSVHLNVRFPLFLYRKLLGGGGDIKVSDMLEELNQIEPEYYRGLRLIMDSLEPLEDMELYFTIQVENFGEKQVEELIDNGVSIRVTQSNKLQYI
jgi:E3 ubiquitin-protein ligase HUWE1